MCISADVEKKNCSIIRWLSRFWDSWQDGVHYKHVLNAFVISFLIFSFPVAAQTGEWKVSRSVDRMTDKESITVSESNNNGYNLTMLVNDNWLYIQFSTPENCVCILDTNRIGLIRFDEKTAIDLGHERRDDLRFPDGNTHVLVGANWIIYRAFPLTLRKNGEHISVIGSMKAFIEAHRLLLRYFTLDGGSHDVEFAMAGSLQALHDAYGLPTETKPDDEEGQKLYIAASFYEPCAEHTQSKECSSVKKECYPLLYNVPAAQLQSCINKFFGPGWQKATFGR